MSPGGALSTNRWGPNIGSTRIVLILLSSCSLDGYFTIAVIGASRRSLHRYPSAETDSCSPLFLRAHHHVQRRSGVCMAETRHGASVLFLLNRYALLATALLSGSQALSASATITVKVSAAPLTRRFMLIKLLRGIVPFKPVLEIRALLIYGSFSATMYFGEIFLLLASLTYAGKLSLACPFCRR